MRNIDHDNFEPRVRPLVRGFLAFWIVCAIGSLLTTAAVIYALYAGAQRLLAHS